MKIKPTHFQHVFEKTSCTKPNRNIIYFDILTHFPYSNIFCHVLLQFQKLCISFRLSLACSGNGIPCLDLQGKYITFTPPPFAPPPFTASFIGSADHLLKIHTFKQVEQKSAKYRSNFGLDTMILQFFSRRSRFRLRNCPEIARNVRNLRKCRISA